MPFSTNPDVVIVGAGAAGIGAGLALTRLKVPFVMLEAKSRIGGRAFTDSQSVGHAWDQGCQWLHAAERNPLRKLAEQIGHPFATVPEDWATAWYDDGRRLSDVEQADGFAAMASGFAQAAAMGAAGHDVSLAQAAGGLTGPYDGFVKFVFEAIGSGPVEDSSAVDTARYDGGQSDLAVTGGYGRLIERLGAGLPVQLHCPVNAVGWRPGGLVVTTAKGTLRPRAVILTVSNMLLAQGRIALDPVLPAFLHSALEDLPCGDCEKIALELTGGALADVAGAKVLARAGSDIFSLQVRPYGRPIVTAYLAGQTARRVSAMPEEDAKSLFIDVLAGVFGTDLKSQAGRTAVTGWSRDPDILGAYSYAKAGRAAARPNLLAADVAPLFLAGEAHHLTWFSTAHGAYLSGLETAHKAARFLGQSALAPDPLWLPGWLAAAITPPQPPAQ